MIGYHYTSYSNWLKIKKQGLVPQEIFSTEIMQYSNIPLKGIWIWTKRLKGVQHIGSILWQLCTKAETKVVYLKVGFHANDLLLIGGQALTLSHSGNLENWQYHTGREEATILAKRIKPSQISLLRVYDIEELIR